MNELNSVQKSNQKKSKNRGKKLHQKSARHTRGEAEQIVTMVRGAIRA